MERKKIMNNCRKNEARIILNKKFYDKEAVAASLRDFRRICKGKLACERGRIKIILKPHDRDALGVIGYEFCNYALGLMKNNLMA